MVIAFFLLLLTTRVMGAMTASALRWAGLGLVDRLAGFALGLARAMLILALCALLAQRLGLMQHESFDRAHSRGLWIWLVQTAEPYWSDMVQAKLRGET
ncbi:MAG: CvpA family protein [Betaproteobacteria bacterium]|nr:CvpA family protein [Betaproteobacteria bacterium]